MAHGYNLSRPSADHLSISTGVSLHVPINNAFPLRIDIRRCWFVVVRWVVRGFEEFKSRRPCRRRTQRWNLNASCDLVGVNTETQSKTVSPVTPASGAQSIVSTVFQITQRWCVLVYTTTAKRKPLQHTRPPHPETVACQQNTPLVLLTETS